VLLGARVSRQWKGGRQVAENHGPDGVQRYDPFDGGLGMSLATRVGSLVYTSGMVGFDGATGTVPADLEDEIRLAFTKARRRRT
jgi:enamine deaminase RidA (YjgF/YER057c/UK114 family)